MIMWFVFLQNMRRIDLNSSCSNSITASFRGQRSSGPQTELDLRGENNNSDSKSCSGSAVFHHQMKVVSSGADSAFRGGKNDSAVSRSILLDLKMLQHRRWPTDPLTHRPTDLPTCWSTELPTYWPADPAQNNTLWVCCLEQMIGPNGPVLTGPIGPPGSAARGFHSSSCLTVWAVSLCLRSENSLIWYLVENSWLINQIFSLLKLLS